MKISTKKGDKGKTTILKGQELDKDHQIIDLVGTIDELNSSIGVATSYIKNNKPKDILTNIQKKLLNIGSNLATPIKEKTENIQKILNTDVSFLEKNINDLEKRLPDLTEFILPGGEKGASHLYYARTVCRKAERKLVGYLKNLEEHHPERKKEIELILIYLNRLSDLLFLSAREDNANHKTTDKKWKDDKSETKKPNKKEIK